MRIARLPLLAVAALLAAAACYHATIDTGRAPNGVQIEKKWAHSFIAGLVPPDLVETASKCPDGLAKVETRLSFLNQVANFVTLGIYSPMEIVVSCAGSTASTGDATTLSAGPDPGDRQAAIEEAATITRDEGEPVYVRF